MIAPRLSAALSRLISCVGPGRPPAARRTREGGSLGEGGPCRDLGRRPVTAEVATQDAVAAPEAPKRPVPPALVRHGFKPGTPKPPNSGRQKGTPNRDRMLSIERICRQADPIGILCDIVSGKPIRAAPVPGAKAELVHPTTADVLAALRILADKTMPDLKAVSVDDGGQLVTVNLQLGQRVTVG